MPSRFAAIEILPSANHGEPVARLWLAIPVGKPPQRKQRGNNRCADEQDLGKDDPKAERLLERAQSDASRAGQGRNEEPSQDDPVEPGLQLQQDR